MIVFLAALSLLLMICFFPEYSQTAWGVRSADQFRSFYNLKPFPSLMMSWFDLLWLFVVILWVLKKIRNREALQMPPWPIAGLIVGALFCIAYGALLGVIYLGSNYSLYHLLREIRPLLYSLIWMLLMLDIIGRDPRRVRMLSAVLVFAAMLHGLEGIVRQQLEIGRVYQGTRMIYFDVADSLLLAAGGFLLLAIWLDRSRPILHSLIFVLAGAPIFWSIFFSFRRSVWLSAAVALLLAPFLIDRARRVRWIVPLALLCAGSFVLASMDVKSTRAVTVQRVSKMGDSASDPSGHFRILDTRNSIHAIYSTAGFGSGFGGRYEVVASEYWLADFIQHVSRTSHNGYLYLAIKMGIPGLIWWLALGFFTLRKSFAVARSQDSRFRDIGLAVTLALITAAIGNCFLPFTYNVRPMFLIATLTSIGLAAWIHRETEASM